MESIADASVISVSSKTQYPEKAVKLLEKIHTDQRYYDLLRYGVEGIHYNLADGLLDFRNVPTANIFGWTPITDYMLSRDTLYFSEKWHDEINVPYNSWQDEISDQAIMDPLGDFSMDLSDLEDVMAEMEQVRLYYFQPILCGYYSDPQQALREADEMLYQAGFSEYFESIQQQVTDYFTGKE